MANQPDLTSMALFCDQNTGHDLKKFSTAQGLFDYVQLLMPFDEPQKLDNAQKPAVVAFMLERNASLAAGTELTPANAARVAIK